MPTLAAILQIITSPLGRYIGYGLIVLAAYTAGDIRGRRIEYELSAAKAAQARAEVAAIDAKAAKQARDANDAALADLKTQKEASDAQLAGLQQELATRPTNAPCLYGSGGHPAPAPSGLPHRRLYTLPRPAHPAGPTVLPSAPVKAPSD